MIELSRRTFNCFCNLQIIIAYYLAITQKRNRVNMQKIDLYIIVCVGARLSTNVTEYVGLICVCHQIH